MRKRLKTIKQIELEWNGFIQRDSYGEVRFYKGNELRSHITSQMLKYFGKEIDVKKANRDGTYYYEWCIDDVDRMWHFKDEWFMDIDYLEDKLFEI